MPSDAGQPQLRLHPMSWLFSLGSLLRQLLVPLIAVMIFGGADRELGQQLALGLFLLCVVLGIALWRQYWFRYGWSNGVLLISQGLVFRRVRHVEFSRIENISTQVTPLHRWLGVVSVQIETSSGGRPEAELQVLSTAALAELREAIQGSRAAPEDASALPAEAEHQLLRLPATELIRYGLIDNRGLFVVLAGMALLQQSGLLRLGWERFGTWLAQVPLPDLDALGPGGTAALLVISIVAAIVLLRLLSVAHALLRFWGFALTERDDGFRLSYGALTRRQLTLRRARIQALYQVQNLLHRAFGRCALHIDLAGGVLDDSESGGDSVRYLAPLCRPGQAQELAQRVFPQMAHDADDWQGLAPGARRRLTRRLGLIWSALLLVPGLWYLGHWGWLGLGLSLPLAALQAHMQVRYTRWVLTPEMLLLEQGWLRRTRVLLPRARVQALQLTTSPFDRRLRMASLLVDTAGAMQRPAFRLRYLDARQAADLQHALYRSDPVAPEAAAG